MDELSRNILRKSGRRLLFRPLPGLLSCWLSACLSGPRLRSHPGLHPGLLLRRLPGLLLRPLLRPLPGLHPGLLLRLLLRPLPSLLPRLFLRPRPCQLLYLRGLVVGGLGCRLGRPSLVPDSPGDSSVRGLFCPKGPMAPARRAGLSAEGECGRHAKAKNSVFCFYFLIKDVSLCSQNNTLSE